MRSRNWWRIAAAVVIVLGLRLGYLAVAYQGSPGGVKRPHIESAALLLALAGLSLRYATDRRCSPPAPPAGPSPVLWLLFACGAAGLYWPALFIGRLSDDFILIQHAAAWDVHEVAAQLFRPLPILTWGVVLHAGGGPLALHLFNIVLHATNAYLAACVATGWVRERAWSAVAGLFVLMAPLGPEAVAWCAGVFDLVAAALMMTAVLMGRRYADGRTGTRLAFLAAAAGALLSKETAVVLPVIVLLDSAIRRQFHKALRLDLLVVCVVAALFGALRLHLHAGVIAPASITRYRMQRLLFDSFGSLAAPWHADFARSAAFVRPAVAALTIALLTAFLTARGARWRSNVAVGAALWILVSILPLLAMFYVGPQLEGARYLYLASVGWAMLLTTAASELSGRGGAARIAVAAAIVAVLGISAVGVRAHLVPWTHAATLRDGVLRAAAGDARLHSCAVVYLQDLPDSVEGAYLFANGAREALADVGVTAFVRSERGACSFRWDPSSRAFVAASSPP